MTSPISEASLLAVSFLLVFFSFGELFPAKSLNQNGSSFLTFSLSTPYSRKKDLWILPSRPVTRIRSKKTDASKRKSYALDLRIGRKASDDSDSTDTSSSQEADLSEVSTRPPMTHLQADPSHSSKTSSGTKLEDHLEPGEGKTGLLDVNELILALSVWSGIPRQSVKKIIEVLPDVVDYIKSEGETAKLNGLDFVTSSIGKSKKMGTRQIYIDSRSEGCVRNFWSNFLRIFGLRKFFDVSS